MIYDLLFSMIMSGLALLFNRILPPVSSTAEIKKLAKKHKRYGYRMITAKLHQEGWNVNHKRVQRIWQKEGLQVPYRRKFEKAKVIVETWRLEYNNHRPHSSLGDMTPAAFAASCNPPCSAALRLADCRTRNMDNSLIECGT